MKRKTRTVMPRRTTPKLRKPAISESEADTNEPSSALSPPPTFRKGSAVRSRRDNFTDDSEKNLTLKATDRSSLGGDPLTIVASTVTRNANASTRKISPEGREKVLPNERTDDIPTSSMIDSKKSRSSTDVPTTSKATNGFGVEALSGNKLIDELKSKFEQLSMLRTTAAESLLSEYKASAEKRLDAAENMIEALRRENELLRKQQQKSQENAPGSVNRPTSTGRSSDVSTLSRTDEIDRAVLEFYRGLSGLQLVPDEDNSQCWHCSLSGRLGEFTFDLRCDQEGSHYEYKPTFSLSSSMASRLPAYLQEEIAFDADQLQLFFWRSLNFLMTVPGK